MKCLLRSVVAAWAVAQCLPQPLAWAQTEESRGKAPKRTLEETQAAREAAARAAAYAALGLKEAVPYSAVLSDPDNLDLNFRFAKTQVVEGDFVGATATLERVLLIQPQFIQARLFYAMVLIRLARFDEAAQELATLRKETLPPAIKEQLEDYARQVALARRRTQFVVNLTNGSQFDTNRNSASASKENLVSDARTGLSGTDRQRRDTSWLLVHSVDVTHDLGTQRHDQLTGSFTYYLGEQTVVDSLDLESFSLSSGAVFNTVLARVSPLVTVAHTLLSRETYQTTQELKTTLERALTPRLGLSAEGGWRREDFSGVTESAAAAERRGEVWLAKLSGTRVLSPSMQLDLAIGYERKDAKADYWTFDSLELTGDHTWVLPQGQFVITSLEYTLDAYRGRDPLVSSSRQRKDKQLRVRTTYGLPVEILIPKRWRPERWFEAMTATATFEQFRSLSTVVNYTYSNSKFNVMLTKQWEF